MREKEIAHVPGAVRICVAIEAPAKKCELKAKTMTIHRPEVPSVVPPLGLKVRMVEMIARKFVAITWQGGFVLRDRRSSEEEQYGSTCPSTLHVRPRRD